MLRPILAFMIAALSASASVTQGQAQSATVSEMDRPAFAMQRATALQDIITHIRAGYVHPAKRAAVIARLEESERQGRYRTDNPVEFAERVTADFAAVTQDKHLYLQYLPDWYSAAILPEAQSATTEVNAHEIEIAQLTNHGLVEMKVMRGNIRYLKIDGFDWIEDETPKVYDGAMRFLRGGAAIIIDLRGNSGGWVQGSKYLLSHFLEGNTLFGTFVFADGRQEQQRAADWVTSGRIRGKPLYVLIDKKSRSAAEQVAYSVQQFQLGELIGETTAGASYTSEDFAVAPGFRLSLSVSEEIHPRSKAGWEIVGVKPSIRVDPAKALDIAYQRAVNVLLATEHGENKLWLDWMVPSAAANLAPVMLSSKELQKFARSYGPASVTFAKNRLWLNLPDRDPVELLPIDRHGLFQAVGIETLRASLGSDRLTVLHLDPERNQVFTKP